MKRMWVIGCLVCIAVSGFSQIPASSGEGMAFVFVSVDEGKAILATRDDYVRRMSPFDRAARMKTDKEVSEKEYLDFVARNVREWSDAEKQKVTAALQEIPAKLTALSVPIPKKVLLVKTTGQEEGGASYTRGNAIVLTQSEVGSPAGNIRSIISHELFHVVSRANPELRDKLYAAIGFVKCDEVEFPPELKSRKITNPDAPANDHCIRLTVQGKEIWAIPILYSSTEKYDPKRGGPFFAYMRFQFLVVERQDNSLAVKPVYDGQKPRLVEPMEVSGFFEQVGKNSQYIIHPEEILADNFALLVSAGRNVPSPEILKKMEEILKGGKAGESSAPTSAEKAHP